MKTARIRINGSIMEGKYQEGSIIVNGQEYEQGEYSKLQPPCKPSALFCVGRNFAAKIDQMDYDKPDEPDFFIKPPLSLHPPETPIPYPEFTNELTYAGELAAVIDQRCYQIPPNEADSYVRGFTILNDLDALDQPRRTARKAFNHSAPLGPCLATDIDPTNLKMKTTINGEIRQDSHTKLMMFNPYEIISFLSKRFTLRPGDVISFGSPENPGLIEPGDKIKIWYENIGTLTNTVVKHQT